MANTQNNYEIVLAIENHVSSVEALAISHDRKFVYSGSSGNEIVKSDFQTGAVIEKITDVHAEQVYHISIAPNREFLVSSGDDDVVKVLSMETLELIQNLHEDDEDVYNYDVYSVAVSPNSTTIAVGDNHGGVKIWRRGTGGRFECTKTWNNDATFVSVAIFSPNGEMLATAGSDKKINVYSVANDFLHMHSLEGHTDYVYSLSFSPDNTRLVSGGSDKSIRLWNPTEGTLLKIVDNAHTNGIGTLAHSPNGNLIASGSNDSTINIRDAKTLQLKFAIDAHSDRVRDLSFTPTGPFLLSASQDKTVKVIKIALFDSYVKRSPVLLAYLRFSDAVDTSSGSEVRKFKKARSAYATKFAGGVLQCGLIGGGPKGVLGEILSYL